MIDNSFVKFHELSFKEKKFMYNAIKDSKILHNFGSSKSQFLHVLKTTSFLAGNSKNYKQYALNLSLLKLIDHYTIEDFVNFLSASEFFITLRSQKDTFLIKQKDNQYGSNNIILDSLARNNRKLINIIKENDKIGNKKEVRAVYIDDFIGTGKTAEDMLEGTYKERIIICFYIFKPTKERLEKKGFKVINHKYAQVIDRKLYEKYMKIYEKPSKINNKYNLNTLISESYRSPNNNFPWLYFYEENNWNNFLNVRNNFYNLDLDNLNVNQKYEYYYFEEIYNQICETEQRDVLSSLGYKNKISRKQLFQDVIANCNFDKKVQRHDESKESAAINIISLELYDYFKNFKESITIS